MAPAPRRSFNRNTTPKRVTLVSVKCISPSGGMSTAAKAVIASIPAGIAAGAAAAGASFSGPGAILAGSAGAVGGFTGGIAAGTWLDRTIFAGADELYIKVNGQKVWPQRSAYVSMKSQTYRKIGYTFSLDKEVLIELFERDNLSADDRLGFLKLDERVLTRDYAVILINEEEGSCYELVYRVEGPTVRRPRSIV